MPSVENLLTVTKKPTCPNEISNHIIFSALEQLTSGTCEIAQNLFFENGTVHAGEGFVINKNECNDEKAIGLNILCAPISDIAEKCDILEIGDNTIHYFRNIIANLTELPARLGYDKAQKLISICELDPNELFPTTTSSLEAYNISSTTTENSKTDSLNYEVFIPLGVVVVGGAGILTYAACKKYNVSFSLNNLKNNVSGIWESTTTVANNFFNYFKDTFESSADDSQALVVHEVHNQNSEIIPMAALGNSV